MWDIISLVLCIVLILLAATIQSMESNNVMTEETSMGMGVVRAALWNLMALVTQAPLKFVTFAETLRDMALKPVTMETD